MSLQVTGLVKHFGAVRAVRGVTFAVQPGECVALIGPNGAGKSTTFACIAGQHAPSAGEVLWRGERMEGLHPRQRLQHGIARTFQVAQTFDALTVLQNVQLLTQNSRGLRAFDVLDTVNPALAQALLARVGLDGLGARYAQDLPYGARKRLELAMALAGLTAAARDPAGAALAGTPPAGALMLLDEPAAGLAPAERASLMQLVQSLARTGSATGLGGAADAVGFAVLYTEHNMDAVFGVADRVLVLIDGEIAAQGSAEAVAQDPTVQARYLGSAWQSRVGVPHA